MGMFLRCCTIIFWLVGSITCTAAEPISFNRDVLPILADHCFSCHGFDKAARQAELRLDRRDDAARVLGDSHSSLLLSRIRSDDDDQRMPPSETGKRLTPPQVEIIAHWIEQGAVYEPHWAWQPLSSNPNSSSSSSSAIDAHVQATITSQRPQLQGLSARADRATLARRLSFDLTGLPPAAEEVRSFLADTRPDSYERLVDRWLASPRFGERWARWWLDLAHYADSDGYLQDFLRPHAWRYRDWVVTAFNDDLPFDEFTVQQLAGDRLADLWIKQSTAEPSVIESERLINWRIATGFLRNTLSNREGGADLEEYRVRQVVDRTNTVATTWLGLTLGCAECHDHKFDPITQVDYYRFYAFFNNADEFNIDAEKPDPQTQASIEAFYQWRAELLSPVRGELDQLLKAWEDKLLWTEQHPGADHRWDRHLEVLGLVWGQGDGEGQLEGINIIKTPRESRTRDEQARHEEYFFQRGSPIDEAKFKQLGLAGLASQIEQRRAALPKVARAQTMSISRRTRSTHLHHRGDFRRPAQEVTPSIPAVFRSTGQEFHDRMDLARWLVSKEQPLTARVTVNRLWQELFGRALSSTPENLGVRGNRPTHPQLLDWLAGDFVERGWSIKASMRSMVLSDVYQQSSTVTAVHRQHDPYNVYLARQSRIRLSAEAVRDMALASSGLLDRRMGGPSNRPPQPDSVAMEGFDNKWVAEKGANRYRRGLYTFIQRTSPFAQSIAFDLPDSSRSCTRRERSNSPLQALTLLNDPVLFEAAVHAALQSFDPNRAEHNRAEHIHAEQIRLEPGRLEQDRLVALSWRILGREPSASEREQLTLHLNQQRQYFATHADAAKALCQSFVETMPGDIDATEFCAWTMTSSVLFNLDEAINRN